MRKEEIIGIMKKNKLVTVIRLDDIETGYKAAKSTIAGGMKAIEITFTMPDADLLIKKLAKEYENTDVIIGAGTVLDAETARIAILAGAQFIVSPSTDKGMITVCNRYRVTSAAGAMTPGEVKTALELGADFIKVFPANGLHPSYIKALHGPFPQADFMVTGSMDENTIRDWLNSGVSVIGLGSSILAPVANGDYELVSTNTRKMLKAAGCS